MTEPRIIETRLLEAVWRETIACFDDAQRTAVIKPVKFGGTPWPALGLGSLYGGPASWSIFPYPLMIPPDGKVSIRAPRQINIANVAPDFDAGVGGVDDAVKLIECVFFFPVSVFILKAGAKSFLDEIRPWMSWLRLGGTAPNLHGALADPDIPGKWINDSIGRITWSEPQYVKGNAAAGVSVMIEFGVRENVIGERQ
jgi:hypothetical protein